MKSFLKWVFDQTPYRVVRATDRNRFAAQQETLLTLRSRGFQPRRIVDGGAHIGDFAVMAHSIFPAALVDLIEPQPACQPKLEALMRSATNYVLHSVAIGSASGSLLMALDPGTPSTGAHITGSLDASATSRTLSIPVVTLDSILVGATTADRVFLKLDLQGWELEALKGAVKILPSIEVILTETSFFAQAYEPPIATLVGFLADHGFIQDDIASLNARQRDNPAHQADMVFIRSDSQLNADRAWS